MVRGQPLYRCRRSTDYAAPMHNHPASLSVREDRILFHVDRWLSALFSPEHLEATAIAIVTADAESHREDPGITRARAVLAESERRLARHGLEAGIPAEVIAPRIAAAQREKAAAEAILALAPPAPPPLELAEVIDTLTTLRDLPALLATVDQADRAALYRALGLKGHVPTRRRRGAGSPGHVAPPC
jgi:hypothetical protein